MLGGLHFLVLSGRGAWDAVDAMLDGETAFLAEFVREHEVQTNEVQRSWALLPAFLALSDGRPLDLLELGPSAGLNLVWDRYRYVYSTGEWGDGTLELAGADPVPPPGELFARSVTVARRRGIDRRPVDVTHEQEAMLLQSFVWPDQAGRMQRLRRAIEIVRADPPNLIRGDYVGSLPRLLDDRLDGAQLVVYETASTQYLRREQHERMREAMHHAGLFEPFVFLTTRSARGEDGYTLELVRWPSGEREALERFDYHGAWLEWMR